MFIETSAIVAILINDPDGERVSEGMAASQARRYSSVLARLETSLVVATKLNVPLHISEGFFEEFISDNDIELIPISDGIMRNAVVAYSQFGNGKHPAKLGFADSIHYAIATSYRLPMLFIGNDFKQTDLKSVLSNPTPKKNWPSEPASN